jgi:EamA domain-containing membrane protein RarD
MTTSVKLGQKSVGVAYVLWVLGVFGMFPLYWFYLGKVPVLRVLTLNWFWIGGIIDAIKMNQYVDEYNRGVL